jgi:hypothetical protein
MKMFCCLFVLAYSAGAVLSAPRPEPKAITASNAVDVQPQSDLPGDVWRMAWGPKSGELSFVAWEKPIELVDATTYKPLRQIAPGKKVIPFAVRPDVHAWCGSGNSKRDLVSPVPLNRLTKMPVSVGRMVPSLELRVLLGPLGVVRNRSFQMMRLRICSALCGHSYSLRHFFSGNADMQRGCNSDANGPTLDRQYLHGNVQIRKQDFFVEASREDQHGCFLPQVA